MKLTLNLAFSCSMRMGEMLGLTWDCVDISDEAIEEGRAFIYIDKEVQRVDKAAIQELHGKDVILVFPEESRKNKTVRVPYSIHEIYEIITDGKRTDIKESYHEFKEIYSNYPIIENNKIQNVVTEDSNSGYQFWMHAE